MRKVARTARAAVTAFVAAAIVAGPALAQESRLVEEVVARVNAEVITRTQYLAILEQTEADIKQNSQSADVAEKRFAEIRPRVLDMMIDNILLVQKGQELGIDVEARVNEQLVRIARENNKSITELEEEMRRNGVDPADVRSRLRERMVRDEVMRQEVYGSIWRTLTDREKHEFYEKNSEKFIQPGELKLSELFLSVEGRSFTEIEATAREVVAAAKGGAAFADLVRKYGSPSRPSFANAGSLGSFKSADELAGPLATSVAPLKTGEVTEPIRLADGVIVIHVDERRDPAPLPYEKVENDVAYALVVERSQEAEQKYLQKLRQSAYIRVSDGYESAIATARATEQKSDK
jgi:peptidyl-prolyl cis-trans isomerase SurA